jgi:Leucine-rich repeat (LRR) protein
MIPNSATFIRPTRKPDPSRSFIEGLRKKYTTESDAPGKHAEISISASKVVEEVGFDKIIQKLSQLAELRIILLDGLQIDRVDSVDVIRATCPNIEELDLSRNRFERLEDIAQVCLALPKLRSLRISGNRFNSLDVTTPSAFAHITSLEISNILLSWEELSTLLHLFPSLTTLIAPHNNLSQIPPSHPFPPSLTQLDLSYNLFPTLSALSPLASLPNLKTLIVSHNLLTSVSCPLPFPYLTRLDVAYNLLPTFQALDLLLSAAPSLTSLRISHNPLLSAVTLDEAHMLTIARLAPSVKILNHSTITPKERENAEIWYLSRIARELAGSPEKREEVLAGHRRWEELCALHGEPAVSEGTEKEKSLKARLVEMVFFAGEKEVLKKVPRGMPVSTLRGCVARWFGMGPLGVKLVCVGEEEEVQLGSVEDTREVGLWVEKAKVRVRVECA